MKNLSNVAIVYVPAAILGQDIPGLFAVNIDDPILKSIDPVNIYRPEAVWQKAQEAATS